MCAIALVETGEFFTLLVDHVRSVHLSVSISWAGQRRDKNARSWYSLIAFNLVSPRSLDFPVSPGRLFFALSGDGFRQVSGGFFYLPLTALRVPSAFCFRCRCPRRGGNMTQPNQNYAVSDAAMQQQMKNRATGMHEARLPASEITA